MYKSTAADVKRERKKSVYLRELSSLIELIAQDHQPVRDVYLSTVDLSADGGICYLYFASVTPVNGDQQALEDIFQRALDVLKLYKPSLRKALAQSLQARYTPDLLFLLDKPREKVDRINQLLDQVRQEETNSTAAARQDEEDIED